MDAQVPHSRSEVGGQPTHSIGAHGGSMTTPSLSPAAPDPRTGRDRDRALRRSGRLRRTLVGGSVAASLAVAGLAGVGALASSSSTAAAHAVSGTSSSSSSSSSSSTGSASSGTSGTSLGSGSGTSHATTSGS